MTTQEWIDELKTISVAELVERIRLLEETFGVSATAVYHPPFAGDSADSLSSTVEQTEFSVFLLDAGPTRIAVIKVVRAATGVGLKEAKALVDAAPGVVKEGLSQSDTESLVEELRAAGATVEIR